MPFLLLLLLLVMGNHPKERPRALGAISCVGMSAEVRNSPDPCVLGPNQKEPGGLIRVTAVGDVQTPRTTRRPGGGRSLFEELGPPKHKVIYQGKATKIRPKPEPKPTKPAPWYTVRGTGPVCKSRLVFLPHRKGAPRWTGLRPVCNGKIMFSKADYARVDLGFGHPYGGHKWEEEYLARSLG